jgi:hypothetical protein
LAYFITGGVYYCEPGVGVLYCGGFINAMWTLNHVIWCQHLYIYWIVIIYGTWDNTCTCLKHWVWTSIKWDLTSKNPWVGEQRLTYVDCQRFCMQKAMSQSLVHPGLQWSSHPKSQPNFRVTWHRPRDPCRNPSFVLTPTDTFIVASGCKHWREGLGWDPKVDRCGIQNMGIELQELDVENLLIASRKGMASRSSSSGVVPGVPTILRWPS